MAKQTPLAESITTAAKQLATEVEDFSTNDLLVRLPQKPTRQYVTRMLSDLVDSGLLTYTGTTRNRRYHSTVATRRERPLYQHTFRLAGLSDYVALEQLYRDAPTFLTVKEDIRSIFAYAFTEMMNNAIDHSRSPEAEVRVEFTDLVLRFTIRDFGIGVFKNVQNKYKLATETEAIQELLKGKTTTAPQAHSGEGIFFTSKIADMFRLRSYDYELLVDNRQPDIFAGQLQSPVKGTEVMFEISLESSKHLQDVFREYTNPTDLSFDKTHAYIKLYTTGTIYVSRSQAKRILLGLDRRKFKEVVLDFGQVPNIGQAFADQIFRVFASRHPDIKLSPINTNEAVDFMIKRVQSPSPDQPKLF